jgi:anti-sigma factor RsiW
MMRRHVRRQLAAYCHGELAPEAARRVADHLQKCPRCQGEYEAIRLGAAFAQRLPRRAAPASLWRRIEARLDEAAASADPRPARVRMARASRWRPVAVLGGGLLLATAVAIGWRAVRQPPMPTQVVQNGGVAQPQHIGFWTVARLAGAPVIGSARVAGSGRLGVGQWLETDGASRARISIADLGHAEIEPNTRLRLVETRVGEHRLALARGAMSARVSAPPRIFFVDTPSAVAIDLGCAYRLEVDAAGRSRLHVTLGWVAFAWQGRESVVPAGAFCETRPGTGPGTPYFEDAPDALRSALEQVDFEAGGARALKVVLARARLRDSLTLWHLLSRLNAGDRRLVYDRLAALAPPPPAVTRAGIMRLDPAMLQQWRDEFAW